MPGRRAAALAAVALLSAAPAPAQDLATLVADRVEVQGEGAITATGNVEVFYEGIRLTAASVRYERAGERLFIDGPITLTDGESVTILASGAELDADLRNGVLLGAQMVLDQELQLASPRIDRVDGRYVQLTNTIATSCRVCASNPTPLWEVRASRVIHDTEERRIYFENAQFRLAGVPVGYLPRFTLPDPTVERASGLLVPEFFTNSLLGAGLKLPYFLTFGPHADVTLTPWLSQSTTTLEGAYRQRFRFGQVNATGAVSDDDLDDGLRAYLFANWFFLLPGEYLLSGNLQLVSDSSYLSDYDFSDNDRLESFVSVRRTNATEDIFLELVGFRTIRGPELSFKDQVTSRLLEGRYETALPTGGLGGQAWLRFDSTALFRPSRTEIDGRDTARVGAELEWRTDTVLGPGIVTAFETGFGSALYFVNDDPTYDNPTLRGTPYVAAEVRWPFQRTAGGFSHLLEPAVFAGWSESYGGDVPNEDSTLVDFDNGNLLALSRFPGKDRTEDGFRAAMGLSYTLAAPGGSSFGAALGRVFWAEDPGIDADSAGLTGTASDWLVSFNYDWQDRISLISRSLVESFGSFSRSETRLGWRSDRFSLGTIYSYAEADLADQRPEPSSEWTLDAGLQINENWSSAVDWRYNGNDSGFVDAGLGVRYENECVRVGVSLSRNFASSATVTPSTDFTFSVAFGGFGDRGTYRRSCTG
ncbi:MAG: LPS assembly protein LptD [Rhodobacteraceae bacterium]|jgi:LPS-assembly protein|nr:LPS assembly protein LptD [Paracoccaceae bacterium]